MMNLQIFLLMEAHMQRGLSTELRLRTVFISIYVTYSQSQTKYLILGSEIIFTCKIAQK
jgi:hypothetical protein